MLYLVVVSPIKRKRKRKRKEKKRNINNDLAVLPSYDNGHLANLCNQVLLQQRQQE